MIPILGIADSVAFDKGFDSLEAVNYAQSNHFQLVQIYLKDANAAQLQQNALLKKQAAYGLKFMCHAPGLLNQIDIERYKYLFFSAKQILQASEDKWVVVHFDEHESIENALKLIEEICEIGLTPCLENYHPPKNFKSAERNYELYLKLLQETTKKEFPVKAVIDIPRIFHANLNLDFADANALTLRVFQQIHQLEIPILLHLIDSKTRAQQRTDWCPLGEGIIPFDYLFQQIFRTVNNIEAIIFEYEDRENPRLSLPFLSRYID